jgi:hypothetical protein
MGVESKFRMVNETKFCQIISLYHDRCGQRATPGRRRFRGLMLTKVVRDLGDEAGQMEGKGFMSLKEGVRLSIVMQKQKMKNFVRNVCCQCYQLRINISGYAGKIL